MIQRGNKAAVRAVVKNRIERHKEVQDKYAPPLKDSRFALGIGLYWGEGSKYDNITVGISNSDPAVVRHFVKWVRCFFKGDFTDFRAVIQHYGAVSQDTLKQFWSKKTGLPVSSIQRLKLSRTRSTGEHKIPNGTAEVRVRGKGVWRIRCKIEKTLSILREQL
jgi:hypothetical protein